jgi:hypothetical protein
LDSRLQLVGASFGLGREVRGRSDRPRHCARRRNVGIPAAKDAAIARRSCARRPFVVANAPAPPVCPSRSYRAQSMPRRCPNCRSLQRLLRAAFGSDVLEIASLRRHAAR